jgi:hypothetical protein
MYLVSASRRVHSASKFLTCMAQQQDDLPPSQSGNVSITMHWKTGISILGATDIALSVIVLDLDSFVRIHVSREVTTTIWTISEMDLNT